MKHLKGRLVLQAVTALATAALVLTAGAPRRVEGGELNIVTTTTDLASIATYIAGDLAQVRAICAGDDDPHFLEAVPSYITIARRADLWIRVGMDLEIGWERPVIDGSRNRRIRPGSEGHLDASENVLRIEVPHERVTPAMGDVHPAGNPHYWTDPLNGRIVAGSIAGRLAELRPAHEGVFRENLRRFKREIDTRTFGDELVENMGGDRLWALEVRGELDSYLDAHGLTEKLGGWMAGMRPHRGKEVVTYHKNWGYFAGRYGIDIPTELEPKPGIPPGARHLSRVIDLIQTRDIPAIVMAPFYPRRHADYVAQRTGAEVVVLELSAPGDGRDVPPYGYLELLDRQVETFISIFEGSRE